MAEKKTGVPCITVQTDGTKLYDKGEEEAYLRLFKTFAKEKLSIRKGTAAVIGATPLDTGFITADTIVSQIKAEGFDEVKCIGFDSGLDEVKNISRFEKIFVISPAGIRAGNYLKDNFSLDVEVHGCPLPKEYTDKLKDLRTGGRTLIIHQQMTANAVRDIIGDSTCGTFFMLDKAAAQEGDFHIKDEEDLAEKAKGFDLIIADISLKRALPEYKGEWFDLPHFAVSGRTFQ